MAPSRMVVNMTHITRLQEFCAEPRTIKEITAEGFNPNAVYMAVRRGQLVNHNAKDAWGRPTHRTAGSFQSTVEVAPKYDAQPLVTAWMGASA
jgi:hypothetical protein